MTNSITIFHSPDADDAFMFYGLSSGAVSVPGYSFTHELCDIETLNQRTKRGELDVTAVSVHALAHLKNQYLVLRCGASMGGATYGPRLIARNALNFLDGKKRRIALPGELTSATLALNLFLEEGEIDAELINTKFDQVQDLVKSGEVDAGLIIHEGQLTARRDGFIVLLDLGHWWWMRHTLPLPLGVNVVRASLGEEACKAVAEVLKQSIEYGLAHREAALDYALEYGRGLSRHDADAFVAMYVNERTLDIGPDGEQSIRLFLSEGAERGFIPKEGAGVRFL